MMVYNVYTDGACSGNNKRNNCVGGFGYIILDQNDEELIYGGGSERGTTNNRMEMTGVIFGLNDLKKYIEQGKEKLSETKCKVFTDSEYVSGNWNDYIQDWKVNGWRKSSGKPVINRDLWEKIDEISSDFLSVEFLWIKGHAYNQLNVKADYIACSYIRKINNAAS